MWFLENSFFLKNIFVIFSVRKIETKEVNNPNIILNKIVFNI